MALGFGLGLDGFSSFTVEAEAIVGGAPLEVEMPRVRAFRPLLSMASTPLTDAAVSAFVHTHPLSRYICSPQIAFQ
jgi:hypothetical protein